jgi:hypothetical protein
MQRQMGGKAQLVLWSDSLLQVQSARAETARLEE